MTEGYGFAPHCQSYNHNIYIGSYKLSLTFLSNFTDDFTNRCELLQESYTDTAGIIENKSFGGSILGKCEQYVTLCIGFATCRPSTLLAPERLLGGCSRSYAELNLRSDRNNVWSDNIVATDPFNMNSLRVYREAFEPGYLGLSNPLLKYLFVAFIFKATVESATGRFVL
ncbi:hypothetical protein CHS0354_035398 [Potamilus streckersoni]|uniref:Uncharacterized protein n=1 Tax=Potamilus streckersoni TaxID=2493646 RepID=A0AAE0WBR8_9BIVA|nr:hypothetical protein CHS0354_035398 [Potamilus streckersoni]